jgi:hypothetical protein
MTDALPLRASDVFEADVLRIGGEDGSLFRVVRVLPDRAILFDLQSKEFAPLSAMLWEELEADQSISLCSDHQFEAPTMGPAPSERRSAKRELVHAILKPLLALGDDLFDEKRRSKTITAIVSPDDGSKGPDRKTVKATLDRYWRYGMTIDAAVPSFAGIGGPGVTKTRGEKKLGRPRVYGSRPGTNVTPELANIFKKGLRRYFLKNRKVNFAQARKLMLRDFCMDARIDPETKRVVHEAKALYEDEDFPSVRQISYWFQSHEDVFEFRRERVGRKKYDRDLRGGTGNAALRTLGPGSRFEIDATIANIYVVSELNHKLVVGRPVIYIVIDVFSKMIVGLYVGLEGPSWVGAMMALVNMATPKAQFCAKYGIQIEEQEWPCHHIPEKLLGDRGEISKRVIENLQNIHHITVESAQSHRPDWKGTVEKSFDLLDCEMKPFTSSYVEPDFGERGARNYVLEACWTISDVTEAMIDTILRLNNSRKLTGYKRTKEMIAEGVPAVPLDLWEWGIARRTGHLRRAAPEKLMFSVMPTEKVYVSKRGINFRGLYYTCDKAVSKKWTDGAKQGGGWWETISFDPRVSTHIYLHASESPTGYHVCRLTAGDRAFAGVSFAEVKRAQKEDRHDTADRSVQQIVDAANSASRLQAIEKRARNRLKDTKRKPADIKDRRDNFAAEKEARREEERFDLNPTPVVRQETNVTPIRPNIALDDDDDVSEPSIFKLVPKRED